MFLTGIARCSVDARACVGREKGGMMLRIIRRFIAVAACLCCSCLFAQRTVPIRCTADLLQFDNDLFPDARMFTGNVEFSHEGSVGYADTVFYYEKANRLEAFGKEVIIHINDSVHLYGHSLRYDGTTRTAVLDGNVMLFDNHSVLYTDLLTFYRSEQYAFYDCGGRIENDSAVLTSQCGYYYTATSDAYFRREVHVQHPEFTLDADTLRYNTREEKVYFSGPTNMYSDSNSIYCEEGWYATRTEEAAFYGPTRIYAGQYLLTADTLFYDHLHDAGKAWSNVFLQDTCEKHHVTSDYMEYDGQRCYAFATEKALAVYVQDDDSLFLHADTLWVTLDSNRHLQSAFCHEHVRFYHSQYQGRCGSLYYSAIDSLAEMRDAPLVWNDSSQFVADTFRFFLQQGELRELHLLGAAFVSQNVWEEQSFNQVKGASMYMYFKDNNPEYMWIYPNAVCLYYMEDNDSALIGVQRTSAERMKVLFEEGAFSEILFYQKIKGTFGPEEKGDERFLPGFQWLEPYRPKERSAVFIPDNYIPAVEQRQPETDEDE